MMADNVDSRTAIGRELDALARLICGACPIQTFCLDFAVDAPGVATDGFWGGLDTEERRKLRRRRREATRRREAREKQERPDRRDAAMTG